MFRHFKNAAGVTFTLETIPLHQRMAEMPNLDELEAIHCICKSDSPLVEITHEEMHALTTPPPLTPDELNAFVDAQRAAAYREESDPLYFKSERGEATREEWMAAIAAIKARYPKTT